MRGPLNIVVTCTNRKSLPTRPDLDLSTIRSKALETRLSQWLDHIRYPNSEPRVQARELYVGTAWALVRQLTGEFVDSGENQVTVWVCSAGYGLCSIAAPLQSYAATFSDGHPESVCPPGVQDRNSFRQHWWTGLSTWSGPEAGKPRSLSELAASNSGSPLIVAASKRYLQALEFDLTKARECLVDQDLLSIVSAGTDRLNTLTTCLLPVDGRLRQAVGGSMHELNVRLVRQVLRSPMVSEGTRQELSAFFSNLLRELPSLPRYARTACSDEEIVRFISKRLQTHPATRPTPLLREFRNGGKASEEKRFKSLFQKVECQNALVRTK